MDEDQLLRSLVQEDLKKSDCESLLKDDDDYDYVVVRQQQMFDEEELLHRATTREEGDIEMNKLQMRVLQSQMTSFEDVFSQKVEMEKVLDITLKESQVMKSKIRDLEELNSASILDKKKNSKLTKEIEKQLIAEMKSPTTFEYSPLMGSDNFSLPESSSSSSSSSSLEGGSVKKSVEHLNSREEEEMVDAEKFRSTISTLQKENEELQSKVAENEEVLKMMQRKLDLVVEEREEERMWVNKEIEELYESVLELIEESETLRSTTDELNKLKKDYCLALKQLQHNAVTSKLVNDYMVWLRQEVNTRNQIIVKLRNELKSQSLESIF